MQIDLEREVLVARLLAEAGATSRSTDQYFAAWSTLHKRSEGFSQGVLELNQGTLYPMLLQLEQAGWITSKWGVSDTGRKAKFYSITKAGRKQLEAEAENWRRVAGVVERF